MTTRSILLATIAIAICIVATPATARDNPDDEIVGGWEQIPNINDPMVLEIARWAVAEHARRTNDGLQFKRLVSGTYQIVAGKNFKLRIDAANGDGKEGIYIAEVFDQPWTHTRTLNSFAPAN